MTRSPRRTISRSTCSNVSLIGSRWIAFGRASASVPSVIAMLKTWLMPPWRMAAANSRAGRAMCLGASPCPYSTAGTSPARRVRRAPPLPNSVRGSALIFTSDTGKLLMDLLRTLAAVRNLRWRGRGARATGARTHAASTAPITAPDRPKHASRRCPRRGNRSQLTGGSAARLRRPHPPLPPRRRRPGPRRSRTVRTDAAAGRNRPRPRLDVPGDATKRVDRAGLRSADPATCYGDVGTPSTTRACRPRTKIWRYPGACATRCGSVTGASRRSAPSYAMIRRHHAVPSRVVRGDAR